jgi:hypothetical protein
MFIITPTGPVFRPGLFCPAKRAGAAALMDG